MSENTIAKVTETQVSEKYQPSERYTEACALHTQIMTSGEIAANALTEMCRSLKEMRDKKLYTELAYETFETYCEEMAHIKARQAYTYISVYERLGTKLLQSNANLGITKLDMIAQLPVMERDEVLQENDFEGMTAKEVKELVEKVKKQGEQISLLTEEKEKSEVEKEDIEKVRSELEEFRKKEKKLLDENRKLAEDLINQEKQLQEVKSKPVDVAVAEPTLEDIAEIKESLKTELEAEYTGQLAEKDNELNNLKSELESGIESKIAEALQEKEKEIEELRNKAALAENVPKGDDPEQEFKLWFSDLQSRLEKLIDTLERIDEDKRDKYVGAVIKYLRLTEEELEGDTDDR